MKLIDADAFVEEYCKRCKPNPRFYQAMTIMFKRLPAVDAVPVIRCKDCKYYNGKWCKRNAISDFDLNDVVRSVDDFCSSAERNEE